jgi:phage tail-like protein
VSTITPSSDEQRAILTSMFALELGSINVGDIQSVSGLSIDVKEVESKEVGADGKLISRFRAGTVAYSEISIKRVFTGDKTLYDWHMKMVAGANAYEDGSIVLYNLDNSEAARWNLNKVWPSKWSVSDLDAGTDDVVSEETTLQIEYMERVS